MARLFPDTAAGFEAARLFRREYEGSGAHSVLAVPQVKGTAPAAPAIAAAAAGAAVAQSG